ncbi:MAG: ABC transporter ATP-binding protein [Candidatus Binatia bacterium]|nr:ABC transporter ATP-binding protein [Candidatus Binatia bacterium]
MLDVTIQKRFGGFHLDVAFAAEHELVVLFGPSGSGKSLTLQAIAGTLRPEAGRIIIDGQTVYDSEKHIDLPPQVRRVGYVPQHYALFPHLTTSENIGFGLKGIPRDERNRRVAELVEVFALRGLEHRRPRELSGGQQQRVALARALAVQPRVLLLDEPFAALDVLLRGVLRQELAQVQKRWGITMLLVTHDLADVFTLGQHVVVYDKGRVIQQGTREEVFFHPATLRVAELVGTRNILPAVVAQVEEHTLWLSWQGHRIAAPPRPFARGSPVYLCIRPTQIMIVRPDRLAERKRENLLWCTIVGKQIQTETYTLHLRVDHSGNAYDLELTLPAYVYHRLSLERQERLLVELRRQDLHIIPRDIHTEPGSAEQ